MDEFIFLGTLGTLLVGVILLVKRISSRRTGRQPHHPVYHESSARKPKHRPAGHTLVHSHSTKRINAKEDIWRASRIKANEAHWQPGVIVANKILTDSELALEEKDPEQGHGMPSIKYSPTESPKRSRTAGSKRSNRRS
ncbi:MAG: hypothetical protein SH820_02680 [Xanthomonadales bacterium]|nr:hypothetical protein [Xanthomonadales bacterium]